MIVNQITNVLKKLFIVNTYVFILFIVSFNVRAEIMEKTLDNGLNIQVPPFIDSGDEVIVDTRNLEYIKKI